MAVCKTFLLCLGLLASSSDAFSVGRPSVAVGSRQDSRLNMSDGRGEPSAKGVAVTVAGGTGFVGSRVCKLLVDKGATVTSISASGTVPKWAEGESWVESVNWKSVDLLTSSNSDLDAAMGKPQAVISCVGTIGTNPDDLLEGNGEANVKLFESAKRVSTKAVAYVSISPEVAACKDGWLPEFFASYFEGKEMAEAAAKNVCDDVTFVRPTFIYGGDSFGLTPPRVSEAYGAFIDQFLSFGLIQAVADVAPGLIKVALRPPVSVEAVAGACVNGVTNGEAGVTILDSAKDINKAGGQPKSTGVTDFIEWSVTKAGEIGDWIREKTREQAYKP